MELASVPGKDKELHSANERFDTLGETAGLANQTLEIMPQLGIHPFDPECLAFVGHWGMCARGVEQGFIGSKQITIVPDGLGRLIQKGL